MILLIVVAWSSQIFRGYIVFTPRWIDAIWKVQSSVLELKGLYTPDDTDAWCTLINSAWNEWKVDKTFFPLQQTTDAMLLPVFTNFV